MAIPDFQSLMLPVLKYAEHGEVRISDATEALAETLRLSPEERLQLLPSGKQSVFANRVGWAKSYLLKACLLESTKRGHFKIAERGREVLAQNPARIDIDFLTQFEEFRQFKQAETPSEDIRFEDRRDTPQNRTPDEVIRLAHEQIEAALGQELLNRILAAPPVFFENLIIALLIGMGYGGSDKEAGQALGKSGDDGVDGVINQDVLGLDRVYVQAKRYAIGNNIGSSAIRDFFGSLDRHKAAKGLFVTTSGFSQSAKETADYLSKRIVLIDGPMLAKLMIRYNIGVRIEETLYLKKVDEEFFE